jgi:hypothetical protein
MTESDARAQRKRDARGLEPCPPGYLAIALGLQTLMTFLTAFLVRANAWDDGAITLAYSRTFAATGRIALTAVSEQVEGSSSTEWFLINALISLLRPEFEGAILAAQLMAGVFLGLQPYFYG